MVRSVKILLVIISLACVNFAQTTNRIVYEGWLDSLATVNPFEDSIISITSDTLINYTLISNLDSLVTTSPFKDSVLNLVADAFEDSSFTEDLRTPVSSIRLPGSGAPSVTNYVGGSVLEFPTSGDASIYFEFQMPHSREEDSDINIHVHYALSANASADDSVRWVISYSWANIDGAIPEPTSVNYTSILTDEIDSTHYIDYIATINGTGKTYSSILLCSLRRDVSEDNYAGSIYLMTLDAHYKKRNYTSP